MFMNNLELIASNVYLWIYNAKNGKLTVIDSVDIYRNIILLTKQPSNIYQAIGSNGLNRSVACKEFDIWYYPKNREYVIWSTNKDSNRIYEILLNAVKNRASKNIETCLKTIELEHSLVSTVDKTLSSKSCREGKSFYDVQETINKYVFNK